MDIYILCFSNQCLLSNFFYVLIVFGESRL